MSSHETLNHTHGPPYAVHWKRVEKMGFLDPIKDKVLTHFSDLNKEHKKWSKPLKFSLVKKAI